MRLEGIDHVAIAVRDVERSAAWYVEVLGLERMHEGMWKGLPVFVGKGTTGVALFPAHNSTVEKPSRARGLTMLHFAMRTDRKNFLTAQRELKHRGIIFQFEDHQISHSIYFHDPDGHRLEITTYEV